MKDLLRCNKLMKYSAILVAFEELCSPNTYKKKKHKFVFFFSNSLL
jgi:hypothetical protein